MPIYRFEIQFTLEVEAETEEEAEEIAANTPIEEQGMQVGQWQYAGMDCLGEVEQS